MPTYAQLAATHATMAAYTSSGLLVGEIDGTWPANPIPERIRTSTHPINQLIMYDDPVLYDDFLDGTMTSGYIGENRFQNGTRIDARVSGEGLTQYVNTQKIYSNSLLGRFIPCTVEFFYRGQETFSGFSEPERIDKTIMQWGSTWESVNIAVKTRGLAPQGSPATIVVGSTFGGSQNYAIVGQKEVNDLEWHHVAVTVEDVSVYADDPLLNTSGLVVSLFVDGVLEGRTPSSIWDGFNTSFNFPGVSGDYWWVGIGSNTSVRPQVGHLAIHNKAIPQERLMSRYAYTQSPRPIINGGYKVWTGSKWENFLV